jgi:hypothetical protein
MKFWAKAASAATAMVALAGTANAATVIGATKIILTSALPDWIQIGELQAVQSGTGINVALASNGGIATGSSIYCGSCTADKAIDGDTSTDYYNPNGIFHSGSPGGGEFLQVDFASAANLSSLTVYSRSDCCTERNLFNVSIFNGAGATLYSGVVDVRGVPNAGPVTVNFDAVIPGGVPEPASWALMIAGFGLVGAAARRRQRTVSVTYA